MNGVKTKNILKTTF